MPNVFSRAGLSTVETSYDGFEQRAESRIFSFASLDGLTAMDYRRVVAASQEVSDHGERRTRVVTHDVHRDLSGVGDLSRSSSRLNVTGS